VPFIIVAAALHLPRSHWQQRLRAV
jgi:hypothetical protein